MQNSEINKNLENDENNENNENNVKVPEDFDSEEFKEPKKLSFDEVELEKLQELNIPKIIFQTWKDYNVPEHWKESQIAVRKYFPDWAYVYHTDEDNRKFIETHYNWFLPIYDNYEFPIMRADAVRYFFLYHYGGLYLDLDIVPTSNFDHLFVENNSEVYFPLTQNITTLTNCIMASKKGAAFWEHMFKVLVKRSSWRIPLPHFAVIIKTGPLCLDGAVKSYSKMICLLPSNIISQNMTNPEIKDNTYTKAIKGRSWNRWDSHLVGFIYINRRIFLPIWISFWVYIIYLFFEYRRYYLDNKQ